MPLGVGAGAARRRCPRASCARGSTPAGGRSSCAPPPSARIRTSLRLIGAIALIPVDRRPLLVLPGYPTAHEAELRQRAGELGVAGDVRFLGWVDGAELEGLYAAARCFVLASLHEGFGLPVLEAMARGVPVACSARGALAEVAGDAALRFDPESEPEIASAIEKSARRRRRGRAAAGGGARPGGAVHLEATAEARWPSYERHAGAAQR